jgi:hypothetical protein
MRRAVAVVVLALVAAGCNGGTVDGHALKQDSDAIDSLACEGRLLANDASKGASTGVFARVHSGVLAQDASNFADALAHRPTAPGIETQVRAEARKAKRIAVHLEELHRHPSDREVAQRVQAALAEAGDC